MWEFVFPLLCVVSLSYQLSDGELETPPLLSLADNHLGISIEAVVRLDFMAEDITVYLDLLGISS